MKTMKYCKSCLQTDKRPNTKFDEFGICPACNYFESLKEVDWEERKRELQEIIAFGKQNNHSGYDCIIGVSGGKDSTRQALYVRNVLKMKPLLVCLAYPPEQITQRGADNISNLISLGFDCITIDPAPVIWKKLLKKGFQLFGNWAKSAELALFSSVPRLAIAYQIPLIWWGENPALQLGDMGALGKTGSDGNNLKHLNTLAGGDITWLLSEEVKRNQILQYIYPSDEEMQRANLRIVYLGYYWKDWSLVNNANYSSLRGLDVRIDKPWEIGEPYGVTALDDNYVAFNQMIKYLKYGFGRTTDYMNEEIRIGRITREEAIKITEKFDGTCDDKFIEMFCNHIGITMQEFWEIVDKFVNKDLFEKNAEGKWVRKFKVGVDYEI
jgi:N-acetyl sugar amidotransferase